MNADKPVYVELLTPRQNDEQLDDALQTFADRYRMIVESGLIASIPDNPMGAPHFQALEVISEMGLEIYPGQILVHLNTFHTKEHMDALLRAAINANVRDLLVVTGDGGERFPKLAPESLGVAAASVTSVELLKYIHAEYKGAFRCGAAFNQYEPHDHEAEKLRRKIEAGARFAISQPVMPGNEGLDDLQGAGIPAAVGVWMSKNIQLLSRCVGYPVSGETVYDPMETLKQTRLRFPGCGLYLALVGFKSRFAELLPLLH